MDSSSFEWVPEREHFMMMHRVFDVDAAKALLKAKARPLSCIEVPSFALFLGDIPAYEGADRVWDGAIYVDWDRVLNPSNVNLSVPVIMATTDGGLMPIDGWHRIALAHTKKIPKLPCVILDRDESESVRRPYLKSRIRET